MKYYLLYLVMFIASNLFGFKLVNQVILENNRNINYPEFTQLFNSGKNIICAYDSLHFYVYMPTYEKLVKNKTKNIVRLDQNKAQTNFLSYKIFVFSKKGKYIKTIGKNNSYAEDGYFFLKAIKIVNNEVQLVASKLISYDKNSLKFKYYIDSSPENSEYSLTVNLSVGNKCYGEQPFQFDISNTNSAFRALLKNDKKYPAVKMMYKIKNFFDIKKYRREIFKNSMKYSKMLKDNSLTSQSLIRIIWTNAVYVPTKYEIGCNNSYYAINGFSTELFMYDRYDSLKDSVFILPIENMRESEINYFNDSKKFSRDEKYFSTLDNFFVDKRDNICFMYFNTSEIIKNKIGSKRMLFAFSTQNKKVIIDKLAIDFYPVTFDEINNVLVGLKIINNKVIFQFYRM